MESEDEELFLQLKAGSDEARQALATKYLPYMYKAANRYGDLNDDIVQEASLRLLKFLDRIRDGHAVWVGDLFPMVSMILRRAIPAVLRARHIIRIPEHSRKETHLPIDKTNMNFVARNCLNDIDIKDTLESIDLTEREQIILQSLINQTWKAEEMADRFGVSVSKVYQFRQQLQVKIREALNVR